MTPWGRDLVCGNEVIFAAHFDSPAPLALNAPSMLLDDLRILDGTADGPPPPGLTLGHT